MTILKRGLLRYIQKVLVRINLLFVFFVFTFCVKAQNVTIYGPTSANLNDTKHYYNTLYNSLIWYEWSVIGQVLSESENNLSVKWIYGGSQDIYFDAEDNWNYHWGNLGVSVSCSAPSPPSTYLYYTTETSFRVDWSSSPGAHSYRLDVSTSSNFSNYLPGYNNLNVGNVTSKIVSGLSCGTNYYYRVRAVNNSCGTSSDSSGDTTTDPSPPNILPSSNPGTFSFTANWQGQNCADYYILQVSTNSSFSTFVSGYSNLSVQGTSALVSVGPCDTYYYRVKAVANGVQSLVSDWASATTEPGIGYTSPPSTVSSSSFTAEWPGACGSGYHLTVSTNQYFILAPGESYIFEGDVGSSRSKLISGLDCNTTYYYRVKVKGSNGNYGPYANATSVTTLSITPTLSGGTDITSNSFIANWSDMGSCASSYLIWVRKYNPGYTTEFIGDVGNVTSKEFTDLDPSTLYVYYVKSKNSSGVYTSYQSSPSAVTTLCNGCRTSPNSDKEEAIGNLEFYTATELYPNPMKGQLNIEVGKDDILNRIDVHDLAGKLILRKENLDLSNEKYELDLKRLQPGTYILSGYSDATQIINQKIIKE